MPKFFCYTFVILSYPFLLLLFFFRVGMEIGPGQGDGIALGVRALGETAQVFGPGPAQRQAPEGFFFRGDCRAVGVWFL